MWLLGMNSCLVDSTWISSVAVCGVLVEGILLSRRKKKEYVTCYMDSVLDVYHGK